MEIARSSGIEHSMTNEHAISVHASTGELTDPLDEDFDPPSDVELPNHALGMNPASSVRWKSGDRGAPRSRNRERSRPSDESTPLEA